ncbi:MAG: aspartate dehydrogenase [Ktedonobacteraceae bacterium]
MEQETLRVGLIGYGAIGQEVARLIAEHTTGDMMVGGALIRDLTRPRFPGPHLVTTSADLLATQPHVVVEVAGHQGLQAHSSAILRAGVDLLLVSIGALAEPAVLQELLDAAQAGRAHVKIVSGAIGALDVLAAAAVDGSLTRVLHTMRRSPHSLLPSEEALHLTTVQEVFRGSARQAVLQFPEYLNVAAAVALAGKGLDQTDVLVLADPTVAHSRHEILAEGAFGTLHFEIENAPMSIPARGARLVAMSIVHTLRVRRTRFAIG